MPLFGRDRNRIKTDTTTALRHPARLRILEVVARERGRRLSVETLTEVLIETPGFERIDPGTVHYHRACLLDAELFPAK